MDLDPNFAALPRIVTVGSPGRSDFRLMAPEARLRCPEANGIRRGSLVPFKGGHTFLFRRQKEFVDAVEGFLDSVRR